MSKTISFISKVTDVFVKPLNMSLNAVDDLYQGCHEEAKETFIPGLLKQELNMTEGFQRAWNANSKCNTSISGGTKDHTAALSVLHFGDPDFLKELTKAVETMGANISTYENNFHFKSLHFLVTESMMLLNQSKKCKIMFAFLEDKKEVSSEGSKVRFASFTLVHSDFESLGDVDGETVLKIESCFYVDLDDHICQRNILKTLISPAEVFTVKSIKKVNNDEYEYTEVTLNHHSMNSTHNCYMFPR